MTNTPDTAELVKRLRETVQHLAQYYSGDMISWCEHSNRILSGADLIERQLAEITLLRECLKKIKADIQTEIDTLVDECGSYDNTTGQTEFSDDDENIWIDLTERQEKLDVLIDAALAGKPDTCGHEWTDVTNSHVQSGELCLKCGAIRAGNQPEESTNG